MKKRLLIIDDEVGIQLGLKEALMDDYDVLLAENCEEALELIFFDRERVDLIITDIILPGMDGLEFLKRVREINPLIPAIVMTGFSTHERAVNAGNLNICGYILKPFKIEELQSKIEERFRNCECDPLVGLSPKTLSDKNPSNLHPVTRNALSYIHRNFHRHFTLAELADNLNLSERHLLRVFTKDCGMTPCSYVIHYRIEKAKTLLGHSKYSIAKIAELVGLKNNSYFHAIFKNVVGVTPKQFRQSRVR